MEHLSALERGDAPWSGFYAARRAAFGALALTGPHASPADAPAMPAPDVRDAAAQALKAGDMDRLADLAEALIAAETPTAPAAVRTADGESAPTPDNSRSEVQAVVFSPETLARARQLGLAARHLEPRFDLASLRRYAWRPLFDEAGAGGADQLPLPAGMPDNLRDGVTMFVLHPVVNSGGARYLPRFLAEDVLVEDHPDVVDGQPPPGGELLTRLRLPRRHGLSRVAIEQALLMHGARILEDDLGLDPRLARLVCIPSDVYVRLGEAEGWGRQPFWTHFDGYVVARDGRLRALAGGDVRFGGLYDIVAVTRNYDSERLVARFAVVPRAGMAAW
jgi:hypothetical protein